MRKWMIICLAVVLSAVTACQKPYTTQIDLGVSNERIDLPSAEKGHCFITVFSSGSWTISIEPQAGWATLDRKGGDGIGYVRLDFTENYDAEDRSATVVVKGSGKQCQIVVTQPHA